MTQTQNSKDESSRVSAPGVEGIVSYDVQVRCPHCRKRLHLNQYPYNDDQTQYCLAEDDLGLALFGTPNEPAKWTGISVEYTCCGCQGKFRLESLEV